MFNITQGASGQTDTDHLIDSRTTNSIRFAEAYPAGKQTFERRAEPQTKTSRSKTPHQKITNSSNRTIFTPITTK